MKTEVYVDMPNGAPGTVLNRKASVRDLADALDSKVHLGVLGAIWTWCGLRKRGLDAVPVLYVNHNQGKDVTCRGCLQRIRLGSPCPIVRRMLEIAQEEVLTMARHETEIRSKTRTHRQIMSLPIYTVTVRMKGANGYYERDYDTRYPEALMGQIMGIKLKSTGFQGVDDKYIEEAEKTK